VISSSLLERVACPVCLESTGCARCSTPPGHVACAEDYARRVRCACGGPDKVRLEARGDALVCPCCGASYALRRDEGYADLAPVRPVGEVTHYADHEFQERLGTTDAEPVLSARVKADMMRRMLAPAAGEVVLDLGCGAGKLALYAGREGAQPAGVDVAPFFLPRAAAAVDLVRGDLRRLPFRKGSFPRAYSLDVLEHLDEAGLVDVLVEARRTVGPQGRLFVYTHAMESSVLARFQRGVNRVARRLGRAGLIDHEREAMRKSDHVNAIRSHEHFAALCAEAGLEVAERRYYNVVFKAVVEDLGLRLYEQARRGKVHPEAHEHSPAPGVAATKTLAPRRPGAMALAAAHALTWLLKLDVVLFGGVRTGPFFGLLRPPGGSGGARRGPPGSTERARIHSARARG
jgi:ubiquinone/menaquinone biosynthesis C-methylase UbiE